MAALKLARISALGVDETVIEGTTTLGTVPGDWLVEALPLSVLLGGSVAHRPPRPLSSFGQPVAVKSSEGVMALLPERVLLAERVAPTELTPVALEDTHDERVSVGEALPEKLVVPVPQLVLLSLLLPLLVAERELRREVLALTVPDAESVLS